MRTSKRPSSCPVDSMALIRVYQHIPVSRKLNTLNTHQLAQRDLFSVTGHISQPQPRFSGRSHLTTQI